MNIFDVVAMMGNQDALFSSSRPGWLVIALPHRMECYEFRIPFPPNATNNYNVDDHQEPRFLAIRVKKTSNKPRETREWRLESLRRRWKKTRTRMKKTEVAGPVS